MTARKAPVPITKKHIARAERERRLRNRILGGTIAVAALVVGLVGYGLYQARVVVPRQPVAIVEGQEILTKELQARVRFGQWNLVNQINNLQQILSLIGDDPEVLANYQNQILGLQQQLANPQILGSSQLELLIEEVLIAQEAERRGIAVSESEVDQSIEEAFGFFAGGTPTPQASATPQASPEAADTAASEAGPTAEAGLEETPVIAGTPLPTASPTEVGTPLPTATAYTRELFESNFQVYINSLEPYDLGEQDLREQWQARLLRERLQAAFEAEVSPSQEQVWARHILVAEQALAEELLQRIADGEAWEELAASFSEDESNKDAGGDLGWFGRGRMVEPFEEAAFAGEVGQIVGPVETTFGWHLIEVLGHEVRELEPAAFELEVSRAFNSWLSQRREQAEVVIMDDWNQSLPSPPIFTR